MDIILDKLINDFSIENLKTFANIKFDINTNDNNLYVNEKYEDLNITPIGKVEKDYKEFGFFAIEVEGLKDKPQKKNQYLIAKDLLKDNYLDYGIFVFYTKDKSAFRLSLVSTNYDENNKPLYTSYKRYTYYVSKNRTNNTFIKQIEKLNSNSELKDILEAFSVEVVSKEFYKKIAYWYFWAYEKIKEKNGFPKDCDSKQKFEFMTSMITRIMFIWFLKETGLVNKELFNEDYIKDIIKYDLGDTYYKAILQNLFFATLSTPINEREFRDNSKTYNPKENGRGNQYIYRYKKYFKDNYNNEKFVKSLFEQTPFFNGGLFECKDIRSEDSSKKLLKAYDGFSDNDKRGVKNETDLFVPNEIFFEKEQNILSNQEINNVISNYFMGISRDDTVGGLFNILSQYNFTIDENTVTDQEISIDPELLGKVFENLLGVQGEDVEKKDRNKFGAFYTPREIVDYMCKESLKEYLKTNILNIDENKLNDLFEKEDNIDFGNNIEIINCLYNIKILDPACGSGAFPMGLLNIIVNVLEKLGDTKSHYNRKLDIIKNCIYGVDILQMAQEISFLRFFLSLLVDQETNNDINDNYGVTPLPNLDFKIMQGNSLVETYKGIETNNLFMDVDAFKEAKDNFESSSHKEEKKKYKKQIYEEVYKALSLGNKDSELKDKIQGRIDKDFFFYEIFFAEVFEKGGFDIVIGNPPYIQLQTMLQELKNAYTSQNFEVYNSMGDIYCLFYEKGIQLLNKGGNLCYITSNKWMRAGYGEKLRNYFCQYDPKLLIDLGPNIFESATVDTNILLIKNKDNSNNMVACSVKNENGESPKDNLLEYIENNSVEMTELNNGAWFIGSKDEINLKKKIETKGVPLGQWEDITINYGIKTGFNDAFIIDTETKNTILNNCATSEERKRTENIIKPILRGRDIKRYSYTWADLWIIGTFPALHLDIKDYPSIKKYFLDNFDKRRLEQTGKNYGSFKARKRTSNDWFETQDQIGYYKDFEKEKIVWGNISYDSAFVYVEAGVYINAPANLLCTDKHLKFYYGYMNSKMFNYLFKKVGIFLGQAYEWKRSYVEKVHVPKITNDNKNIVSQIENLVDTITEGKKQGKDTTKEEEKIDQLVYTLYDLTPEEIAIIENN